MDREEFKKALEGALKFFPGIKIKPEQELCLESLVVKRKDVLGVLATGYGKSLIYQLLPKLMSEYWFLETGIKKTISVLVVSPLELIRRQQVERLNVSGLKATLLEDLRCEDLKEIEIVFGSAEQWLSEKWRSSLKSGNFKGAEFLVVDEVDTVETW
ncbi:3 flap structured DNA binding [Porites harrisoni]